MFSILGMINSYIGYFSMNAKLKSQVYTALGTLGNFYLLYVAYRFFANGFYLRGFLYILSFFVLAYFAYLNILYYFTKDKSSKYDITPKIEQLLGIKAKDHLAEYEKRKNQAPGYVQTNGIFKDEEFLPSVVTTNAEQKANIQALVKDLANVGYLDLNYGGMSEDDMLAIVREGSATSFQALAEPVALPYFELVERAGRMFIYGGANQMEAKPLGEVRTIGLLSAREAAKRYKLSVATACLTKGPYKVAGRSSMLEKDADFELDVQIAYRDPEKELAEKKKREEAEKTSETMTVSDVPHHLSRKDKWNH